MTNMTPILFILLLSVSIQDVTSRIQEDSTPSMSSQEFQNVLFTEVHGELETLQVINEENSDPVIHNRALTSGKIEDAFSVSELGQQFWEQMIEHGWFMSKQLAKSAIDVDRIKNKNNEDHWTRGLYVKKTNIQEQEMFPFLICDRSSDLTGNQRVEQLLAHAAMPAKEKVFTVVNDNDQTCFYISAIAERARFLEEADGVAYAVVPMTDLMKISRSTITEVSKEYWPVPSVHQVQKQEEVSEPNDWERTVRIMLAPNERKDNDDDLLSIASTIIEDIKGMGQVGSRRRRRRNLRQKKGSIIEEALSLTDAFSLTSTRSKTNSSTKKSYSRRTESIASTRAQDWSRVLEEGIEAEHSCKTMFDSLEVRPHYKNEGFDLVLNPRGSTPQEEELSFENIESSASNVNCIISLLVGASVHPNVLNVEVDTPITPDDFEAQWITQSNSTGYRPFFHAGLKGAGQIISVVDSGLDMEHPLFGPAADSVKGDWDLTRRKVVKYDYSMFKGDYNEEAGGHGSKVAAIIAGRLESGEDDNKDGIAIDAKLHIFDIQVDDKAYTSPGPRKIFRSAENGDGGAKIINTSWSSSYKGYYTGTCRNYDEALYDNPETVVVASIGNSNGRSDGVGTVGDPASCKNSIAVGASQSAGERIGATDHGHGNMADFSSRGPTSDKRMKPDIVAPGYSVLTVSVPNEEKEVMGTSYSAPVVSGNAAIVRQYFEEGWYPRGTKGSGKSIQASGSLVKAVLVNGAHALHGIQSLGSEKLEVISEYDNNQGPGALNLMSTLFLKGANSFRTVIRNDLQIEDRKRNNFYIQARSDNELSATLAWYDPPSETNCAHCLLNNLDLWVTEVNQNGRVSGPRMHANGLTYTDKNNTVERVRVQMKAGRRYRVTVSASNLSEASTNYSLIFTGKFKSQSRVAT